MRAVDVVEAFAAVRGLASVVTGPGALAGATFVASADPATIYNMELGYATATALGVALAVPDRRAVAIEGDGSFVAGLPVIATIARYRPPNLVVIVVDNGIFGTGAGTIETATRHGTDIAAVGRACGIPAGSVRVPDTIEDLGRDLATAMSTPGPWLIVARVTLDWTSSSAERPRPGLDFVEAALRFQSAFPRA